MSLTTKKSKRISLRNPKRTLASSVKNARGIPKNTEILLAVRAGGRCQFAGCNRYLYEHSLSRKSGNFSEKAHIVAFSSEGPRGKASKRTSKVHDIQNLMLLCAECHKEIDTRPGEYPRSTLEAQKLSHEDRVHFLTGLGPDQRTTVVQLKSRIAGDAVDIPVTHIYAAIAPRYPADAKGHIIDLTHIKFDNIDEYYAVAKKEIALEIPQIFESGMSVETTRHISLFALAQIPLLMFLGRCLSNKIDTDFFQRHRTEVDPWVWPEDGEPVCYRVNVAQEGSDPARVALVLSMSGPIAKTNLPSFVNAEFTIYEITLENMSPGTDFLRKKADLTEFRRVYRSFLAELRGKHPSMKVMHVFPAVPAPIAIACGYDLLPKVDPTLVVYDADRRVGAFIRRIEVNEYGTK